jgi:hypothetical protein
LQKTTELRVTGLDDSVTLEEVVAAISADVYADDMLVLVWGSAWGRMVRLAEMPVACVVASIEGLGLEVSLEKTEAL